MKLLFLIITIFLSTPSKAITWKEFWKPFNNGTSGHYYNRYSNHECFNYVYREEYVPGNIWSHGYVRRWKERVRVPCYY